MALSTQSATIQPGTRDYLSEAANAGALPVVSNVDALLDEIAELSKAAPQIAAFLKRVHGVVQRWHGDE